MRIALKRLQSRARLHAPYLLRSIFRALRLTGTVQVSRPLPPELVRDCRVVASRVDMLDQLPHGSIVAELGSYRGEFAHHILARTQPRELHLIDVDFALLEGGLEADRRVTLHRGFAHEQIARFSDNYFDWIYIDADHSYDAVLRDALAAAAKVKPNGFLVFNDFAHIDPFQGRYGVHRAVTDFALETGWPIVLLPSKFMRSMTSHFASPDECRAKRAE